MRIFKRLKKVPVLFLMSVLFSCTANNSGQTTQNVAGNSPRIINIINFVRQCEPRIDWITEDVLFETVVEQIKILNQYHLKGSFLLQYDALMDSRYQELFRDLPAGQFEIGAWWEIPQPLVENSGLQWRGRYPWDWHADVGFATGYTPEERETLVDTYMADFKKIFGSYPKSAGSWFIDAHTLKYMHDRYGIIASCNCKDQIGTDGYTLWGGYWSQAYYPSIYNAYMPAQNRENQIPVPIFRMLGSDPIHQYDNGLGGNVQKVVSLEPVYKGGGGNAAWCDWYFKAFVNGAAMEYAYAQTGQENSFTWKKMSDGFKIQMPALAKLRDENKIRIETLAESGEWFRHIYKVTPPTSVTVLSDHSGKDLKTVWFNSRYYRANLLWEKGTLRFRDIHIFDENLKSDYLTKKGETSDCTYYTLPFVDGFQWSSARKIAGLRFKMTINDTAIELKGRDPYVDDRVKGQLIVTWPLLSDAGEIKIIFDESTLNVNLESENTEQWFLELSYAEERIPPFIKVNNNRIECRYKGFTYTITSRLGEFLQGIGWGLRILPEKGRIILDFSR